MKKYFLIPLLLLAAGGVIYFAATLSEKELNLTKPSPSPFFSPSPPSSPSPQEEPAARNMTDIPLKIPSGFSFDIFAQNLENPRDLIFDPQGNVLVSIPAKGLVLALLDKNKDGKADETITLVKGLNRPHGLAYTCYITQNPTPENQKGMPPFCLPKLYIAESHQVSFYDYVIDKEGRPRAENSQKLFDLPDGGNHFTRSLLIIEDMDGQEKLLTSVGSSCNVCSEKDSRRAKILISHLNGSGLKEYARGLRNSVFMTLEPRTKKIFATEMGRDLLGDDIPPDEINIIEEGKYYGWPICYGKNIHDTNFDKSIYKRNPCVEPYETPSFIDIPAHSAPLGLAFFPESFGKIYENNLLVAYHGSWNRTAPTGYKIVRYKFDRNGAYQGSEDFVTGWLKDDTVLGRPVDILLSSDGIIYISDDKRGVIYMMKKI